MVDEADLPVVRVDILPDGPGSLKIVWNYREFAFQPYFISRNTIDRKAAVVRSALMELVRVALTNSIEETGPQLRALALAGAGLRRSLFVDTADSTARRKVEGWFFAPPGPSRHLPDEFRLTFRVEDGVYVPWGLMYDGDEDEFITGVPEVNVAACSGFWAVRYHISTVYYRISPVRSALSGDRLAVLPVVHREAFDRAREYLLDDTSGPESYIRAFTGLFSGEQSPIYQTRDLYRRWSEASKLDGLLYFYCHASGTSLALAANDMIDRDDFRERLAHNRDVAETLTMVFMNGCVTAVGNPGGGFLEVTGGSGFCGFVGTEASVPDVFAMRFGIAFLSNFLNSRKSILSVMSELRRQHLPLSLLYSTCCDPHLRVDPRAAEPGVFGGLQPENISLCKLGTEEL